METGSELSKTVAIFIVQKILLDETGLTYICHTYERFFAVVTVLSNMVSQLVETQAVRLLKHVVRCYLRLSDNPKCVRHNVILWIWLITVSERVRHFERVCLNPFEIRLSMLCSRQVHFDTARSITYIQTQGDQVTKRCLATLQNNLSEI